MATCKDVFGFLDGVRQRLSPASLSDADLATLQQLNLIEVLTADQYQSLGQEVATLAAAQQALRTEQATRDELARTAAKDTRRTHSILFRLEGHEAQASKVQRATTEQQQLQSIQSDFAARTAAFDALLSKRSVLETVIPLGNRYVGLTSLGAVQTRDLGVRLYRVSDLPFESYWQQTQAVQGELTGVADRGAQFVAALSGPIGTVDRSYLWAIAIGLAKLGVDVGPGATTYLSAYSQIGSLARNAENRLLSAEILAALPQPVPELIPVLTDLERQAHHLGVPKESSLGVASILLLGRRADGTFAIENLRSFLGLTRSYESAALLAILNRPFPDLSGKFTWLRNLFGGWGYEPSEDVELASAYLALSDLPVEGINTKLAIIARGMNRYLEYPLVASAILASIPVLEANDTLNLLEEAYEIVGARALPMQTAELISLAVRMVHGIRSETVGALDTTPTAVAAPTGLAYLPAQRFLFVPIMVVHGSYYSTFSGVGGVHPGHVHFAGGAGGG